MEHIVQFGICIDDDAIRRRVEQRGYEDVIESIKNEAIAGANLPTYCLGDYKWTNMVDKAIRRAIDEWKAEIVERAADMLVERYVRTKAFRERMAEAMGGDGR